MEEEGLGLAERLDVVVSGWVVDCAGGVVRHVVAVEADRIPDELGQHRAQIHDGDVHQDKTGAVPQAPEEGVADYDERRPEHGEDAGDPHQDPEGDPVLPAKWEALLTVSADDSLFT